MKVESSSGGLVDSTAPDPLHQRFLAWISNPVKPISGQPCQVAASLLRLAVQRRHKAGLRVDARRGGSALVCIWLPLVDALRTPLSAAGPEVIETLDRSAFSRNMPAGSTIAGSVRLRLRWAGRESSPTLLGRFYSLRDLSIQPYRPVLIRRRNQPARLDGKATSRARVWPWRSKRRDPR